MSFLTRRAKPGISEPKLRVVSGVKDFEDGANRVRVLDGVDLSIGAGEFVLVSGRSGSGKSTLLHVLGLLDRLSDGEYLVEGQSTSKISEVDAAAMRNRMFGFVAQRYNLLERYTAWQNVLLPFEYSKGDHSRRIEELRDLAIEIGLGLRLDTVAGLLSGGEQQRVALLRAFACSPPVVVADEPTGAVDAPTAKVIAQLLARLSVIHKTTVVVASHDVRLFETLATNHLMVEAGRLVRE